MKRNKIYYSDYKSFRSRIEDRELIKNKEHNEVLARIRWNKQSSTIGIFSDTADSRYLAQFYARKIKDRLREQAKELKEVFDERYEVPIVYYTPGISRNMTRYTKAEQDRDFGQENHYELMRRFALKKISENHYELARDLIKDNILEAFKPYQYNNHDYGLIIGELLSKGKFEIILQLISPQLLQQIKSDFKDLIQKDQCESLAIYAFVAGDEDLLQLVQDKSKDALTHNRYLENNAALTPFLFACQRANLITIERRLSIMTFMQRDSDENNAFHLVAREGHLEALKRLIQFCEQENTAEQYMNARNKQGHTPLYLALYNGHSDIAEILLSKHATLSITYGRSVEHQNLLEHIVTNNHGNSLALLLKQPSILQFYDSRLWNELFHLALTHHSATVIGCLLQNQPTVPLSPLELDNLLKNALLKAVDAGKKDVIIHLLAYGQDPNVCLGGRKYFTTSYGGEVTTNKTTALEIAIRKLDIDMIQCLLSKGANRNLGRCKEVIESLIKDLNNLNSKDYKIKIIQIVCSLLSHGIEFTCNQIPNSVFDLMVRTAYEKNLNWEKLASKLIQYGFYEKTNDRFGSVIMHAVLPPQSSALSSQNNVDLVAKFIDLGFSPNLCGAGDWHARSMRIVASPLRLAISRENFDMVKLLVNRGANVNCEKSKPLRCAIEVDSEIIAKYLTCYGAKLYLQETDPKRNALLMAAKLGHKKAFQGMIESIKESDPHSPYGAIDLNAMDLVREIHRAQLKEKLADYKSDRESAPDYKRSYRFFGLTRHFGHSKTTKLAAAEKFEAALSDPNHPSLEQPGLEQGELGLLYKRYLKLRP